MGNLKDDLNKMDEPIIKNLKPKDILTDIKDISTSCATATIEEAEQIWPLLEITLREDLGFGLAANQIGIPKKVGIIKYAGKTYRLLNTKIIEVDSPTIIHGEGCLSLPGKTINTKRFAGITVQDDVLGKVALEMSADGLLPIIFQHEIDHFEGKTILDRQQTPYKRSERKVGRNELCPCGSGKKYKKCCGKND